MSTTALGPRAEDALRVAGLDLHARLPFGAGPAREATLIGNSRALWPPFVRTLRAEPDLAEAEHPLDTYVHAALQVALGLTVTPISRVVSPYEAGAPSFVALAVDAGVLWRGPGGLGIHPVFGPWTALRALVIHDKEPSSFAPAPTPCAACEHCTHSCGPAFAELAPVRDEAEFRRNWRRWADARAACPTGADERYDDDQLEYHYTRDRAILRRLAATPPATEEECPPH